MPSGETYRFRIFVTGDSLRARRAVENLNGLCDAASETPTEIEVVDVLVSPQRAEEERIIATPTVLRLSPAPGRRVIGDLADFELAAEALGLLLSDGSASP